jgi:hypothetical protein
MIKKTHYEALFDLHQQNACLRTQNHQNVLPDAKNVVTLHRQKF